MKRIFICIAAFFFAANVNAQNENIVFDTTNFQMLQEVVVSGVKVQKNAPYAITEINKTVLDEFSKTGKELPFLFSRTPGIISWSENGVGTGTSYMRIRGAGDSRINVTLDGVPLNSPEDQCVFWANMNSYSSILGNVEIQRGVGASTNGDGAFGGTITLVTAAPSTRPSAEITGSYGSFNTLNFGANASTGLLWNHLIIDGAYHETSTDGFLHGTSGRSGSFYGGTTWMGKNFVLRYKNIGNFENTGQAWNGVVAGNNDLSLMDGTYGMHTGIKTYEDMYNVGLGRFNNLYEYIVYDENGNFKKDENGKYITERYKLNDGSYWDKTTDNFWQDHNLLSAAWEINDRWSTTATLHYTYGYGFYDEFRPDNKLANKFGINEFQPNGKSVKSDVIRKKGLDQNTYGFVWYTKYTSNRWDIIGGFNFQDFKGNHFGYVTYIANDSIAQKYLANGDYQYYDSDAKKNDRSIFIKTAYSMSDHWDIFVDLQYRLVKYKTTGVNDKFIMDENGNYVNQLLNITKRYDFFNPKAGLSYNIGNHHAYGSVAVSHREPERNNFTDNGSYPAPKPEQLIDYELGYDYTSNIWHAGLDLYYMDYNNQFVQTGAVSDIGEALTTNIKKSYRTGIELEAGVNATRWLSIEANAAFSLNKIKDFDEVIEDWDDNYKYYLDENGDLDPDLVQYAIDNYHIDGDLDGYRTIHYNNSTLAFSPSTILNGFIVFHHKGIEAIWHTNFVSRMYLDNTENKDRSLPAYSVSDITLGYTYKPQKFVKEAIFRINFGNIFNKRYAANGWVYSAICESAGHTNDNRYYQIGFMPMAGFNVMANLTLKF